MPRQSKRAPGLYQRAGRWWGRIGAERFPLVPAGERLATRDVKLAQLLYGQQIKRHAQRVENMNMLGYDPQDTVLKTFVQWHLEKKAASKKGYTERYLESEEKRLEFWCRTLGDVKMGDVTVASVQRGLDALRGRDLGEQTLAHYANSLSNCYRRAIAAGLLPPSANPVAALGDERPKPPADRKPRWFESDEAALLLEAARRYEPTRPEMSANMALPIFATLLLAGLRREEALGLLVKDIDFKKEIVNVERNAFRRLKSRHAERTVPLAPQLSAILREYLARRRAMAIPHSESLLFPSARIPGQMFDPRKALAGIAKLAGYDANRLTCHSLRHTFCAAALQTLDNGAAISPYTVQRWMGHGSVEVTLGIYGKLGTVRSRTAAVEFTLPAGGEGLRQEVRDRIERLGWRDLLVSAQPVAQTQFR
jgi:integrase